MKNLLVALVCGFALQSFAAVKGYGAFGFGFMVHKSTERFLAVDKYLGGLGFEYMPWSFFSIGAEGTYARGVARDPRPEHLGEAVPRWRYGGFSDRGVDFVKVDYFELWLRPKFILPLPLIEPYVVIPVSPLSRGGMRDYAVYGAGLGVLAGLQISMGSLWIFAETGSLLRTRKGVVDDSQGPPWQMFDVTVPLNVGLGFLF